MTNRTINSSREQLPLGDILLFGDIRKQERKINILRRNTVCFPGHLAPRDVLTSASKVRFVPMDQ